MHNIGTIKMSGLGLLIFTFLTFTAPASAQLSRNNKAPIDITAAKFEADDKNDFGVWTGDVQVVQGEVLMTAPKLIIHGINEGNTDRIEASGGMRYTNGTEAITGDHGVYDATHETITVTGNVIVVQGEQVMTGGRLVYNIKSGEMTFSGGGATGAKGRVRGIFKTGEQQSNVSAS